MRQLVAKERLLNTRELGDILNVSKRTIYRLNSSGKIPSPIRINGAVRWRESDIEQWIQLDCIDRKSFENMKGGNDD